MKKTHQNITELNTLTSRLLQVCANTFFLFLIIVLFCSFSSFFRVHIEAKNTHTHTHTVRIYTCLYGMCIEISLISNYETSFSLSFFWFFHSVFDVVRDVSIARFATVQPHSIHCHHCRQVRTENIRYCFEFFLSFFLFSNLSFQIQLNVRRKRMISERWHCGNVCVFWFELTSRTCECTRNVCHSGHNPCVHVLSQH